MTKFILSFTGITLTMSCVIGILLLLAKLFGTRFTHTCRYIIWTLVILRLCVPFTGLNMPSLFEVNVPLDKEFSFPAAEQVIREDIEDISVPEANSQQNTAPENGGIQYDAPSFVPDVQPGVSAVGGQAPVFDMQGSAAPNVEPDVKNSSDAEVQHDEAAKGVKSISLEGVLNVICIVWLGVAVLYFIANIGIHTLYSMYLLRNKKAASLTAKQVYTFVGSKYRIKKLPRLYVVSGIPSPMLSGYFRPVVMIPDIDFDQTQLEAIFDHELTHYRRHDLWTKLLCLLGVSLQWFNPLAYLAAKHCNNEMELSCDELVLKGSCKESRRDYGMTMLEIAKNGYNKAGGLTTMFNPKKKTLKDRLTNIMDMTKKRAGRWLICAVSLICVTAGIVIGSAAIDTGDNTTPDTQTEDTRVSEFENIWRELNADGKATEQCHDFFYDMLSGKSQYKEYNDLGIKDWSLKRIDENDDYFAIFEFDFTVTGNTSETLPKGTYKKYVHDIRNTIMYDDREMTITNPDRVYGDFASNEAAQITVGYILSAYHWELVNFGQWNGYLPVDYIVNRYGKNGEMPLKEFMEAAEKYVGAKPDDFENVNVLDGNVYAGGIGGGAEFAVKNIEEKYGIYYVTVQFYGDFNRILPSHTVIYRVGEDGCLFGMNVTKRAEYEPIGLVKYTTDKPTEVYNIEDCEALGMSKSDMRYIIVKAFLEHDIEVFKANYYDSDMYDELKELEFGKYVLKRDLLTGEFSLEVEITKGNGRFNEGTYSFGFNEMIGGMNVYESNKEGISDAAEWLMDFIDYTGMYELDLASFRSPLFAEYIINKLGGEATLYELVTYAGEKFPFIKEYLGVLSTADLVNTLFGVSFDEISYDTEAERKPDTFRVLGHGGLIIQYTITDEYEKGGETVVRVQFYADVGKLIKSHLVDYRMKKDGDGWVILGAERVETGKYDPFIFMN